MAAQSVRTEKWKIEPHSRLLHRLHFGMLRIPRHALPDFGPLRSPYDDDAPPKGVINSPYYWWFKFLRLNPNYSAVLSRQGRRAGALKEIYVDFGDVHATDFKSWWLCHYHLFGVVSEDWTLRIAFSKDELVPFSEYGRALNVTVPLDWDRKTLLRQFESILDERLKPSEPKYRLNIRGRPDAMEKAYRVYTSWASRKADADAEVPWAEIAIDAKLVEAQRDTGPAASDKRRDATSLALRHFRQAKKYIAAAASHQFPQRQESRR